MSIRGWPESREGCGRRGVLPAVRGGPGRRRRILRGLRATWDGGGQLEGRPERRPHPRGSSGASSSSRLFILSLPGWVVGGYLILKWTGLIRGMSRENELAAGWAITTFPVVFLAVGLAEIIGGRARRRQR